MAWISELLAQIDSSMVTKPSLAVWQPSPKGAEPRAKGLLFLDSFFAHELTNHRVVSFHTGSHRNRNRNHPTSSNFSQVSQRVVQLPLTQLRACDPARLSWAVTRPGSSRGQPQGILDVRNDGMNQSSSVNRADGRFPPLPVISKYPETSLKIPSRSHFDGTVERQSHVIGDIALGDRIPRTAAMAWNDQKQPSEDTEPRQTPCRPR
ncbi:hypothetical protein CKAH01_17748 [Colletotrichum kahawae]|uniref:Uncharacterized protein n=1 Tax=Colletotrichum kahawae TaxID=34407 RepID=A0AAD9YAW4_COLKA|nr:hypothetical protein CKAH01_17748 [Colletotrichum kahawae]